MERVAVTAPDRGVALRRYAARFMVVVVVSLVGRCAGVDVAPARGAGPALARRPLALIPCCATVARSTAISTAYVQFTSGLTGEHSRRRWECRYTNE